MGQYFRLWLENEGLFPENYIPRDGAVRFYANGLQRTQATAHYFSAGLLPVAVVPVERHVEYNKHGRLNQRTASPVRERLFLIPAAGGFFLSHMSRDIRTV